SPVRSDQRKLRAMKILYASLIPFLVCIFLTCCPTAVAQQIPSSIATDPGPDKDFPPSMDSPDIMSHGSRLNALIYVAGGGEAHGTVLLMHGFPGNEQNLDLAYSMRRAGWNVLFPHYRGSWGSAGTFSFNNAIEDTQAALDFLHDPANVKKYRINTKRIVLIGHSMGGFMVAYTGAQNADIGGIAMVSPWKIGIFGGHMSDAPRE